jgi:hypothetical protein
MELYLIAALLLWVARYYVSCDSLCFLPQQLRRFFVALGEADLEA